MTKNLKISFENVSCRCCSKGDREEPVYNIYELKDGHYYILGHKKVEDYFILTARLHRNKIKCNIINFFSDEYITNYILEHNINTYFNVVIKGGKVKSCGYIVE